MTAEAAGSVEIMGIINVTPDSFFDGSRVASTERAVERARSMIDEGATIIDVGGESTRPGASPVPTDVELARVSAVIAELAGHVKISIDTRHAPVARAAVAAGAVIINDVSASLDDIAAQTGAGWVAMHMRGTPQSMQNSPTYDDVVGQVLDYVVSKADRGRSIGVENIWIDPGIGFGKNTRHNHELMAHLDQFVASGYPVLVGVSRKRFIGRSHADVDGVDEPLAARDRLEGSLAMATWAMRQGAAIVRVHDVAETVACAKVLFS